MDSELSHPNFGTECSDAYITAIRTFVEQHIITPLAIIRKQRGLPDGLQRSTQRGPDEHSQGRLNLWSTTPLCVEPLASAAVIDNTARVTEEQLRSFLASCQAKFVKAKIEPGTFPPTAVAALHSYSSHLRVYGRGSRGAINWRARDTDDFENVPLCWGGIYECNSRCPPNQGNHQCRQSHQHSYH